MTRIVKYATGSEYEKQASYSRAVAVDNWIYVSNTAGRNPKTKVIPEDIVEQTHQVIANIAAALAAADSRLDDVIFSRVYIQDPQDIARVIPVIGETFRGINPATTITCPPLGSSVYKVEIEVTAYRNASQANVETVTIAPQA